jgi:flagellar hook-basal body complex protein FliE
MAIGPIGPYLPAQPGLKLQPPKIDVQPDQSGNATAGGAAGKPDAGGAGNAASAFSKLLSDAVQNIDGLQKTADANVQKLATGQPVDLHDVTISMEQANLTFQLGMQVRNKLIDAYQEVMRMQV